MAERETPQAREDRQVAIARRVMAELYAAGDEVFVGECIHSIVMMWIDERVFADDAEVDAVTSALASLAGRMRAAREQRGLDPTTVDRPAPRSSERDGSRCICRDARAHVCISLRYTGRSSGGSTGRDYDEQCECACHHEPWESDDV